MTGSLQSDPSRDRSPERLQRWDVLCNGYEQALRTGQRPPLLTVLRQVADEERPGLLEKLLAVDWELSSKAGKTPTPQDYVAELPEYETLIGEFLVKFASGDSQHSRPMDETVLWSSAPDAPRHKFPLWIGDYQILGEIAHGGMGVVYKAQHRTLKRLAAVKLIKSGDFAGEQEVRRFQTEAAAAAKLDHPGIVPVYEAGEQDGQHFLAMAFVDGQSLWQQVQESPLAPQQAARLMQQVAEAVQYAHERGIIHRDLKPQNILIAADGQPRVTDFGLAKSQGTDSSLTETGDILGTPSYMPPEQASGKTSQAGPAADVYSLGATLYCLLTGRPPFQAATKLETLLQVTEQEPVPPRQLNPSIPKDLETICLKCLQKEPSNRYAAAALLAEDLAHFLAGEPITARPESLSSRLVRRVRRHRIAVAASVMVSLTILVSVGFIVSQRDSQRRQSGIDAELQQREQSVVSWEESEISRQDALLAKLQELSPASFQAASSRFVQTLFSSGKERLQKSQLQPVDEDYVRSLVSKLQSRNPEFAQQLEQDLQSRQRAWEELFHDAPYEQAPAAGSIVSRFIRQRIWLTPYAANGNVRASAVWNDWQSAAELGIAFQSPQDSSEGYLFLIRTSAEVDSGAARSFLEASRGKDKYALSLQIWRNGVQLREVPVPSSIVEQSQLKLETKREGDDLQVRLNDEPPIIFWDPFALPLSAQFGLIGPPQVQVVSFSGWHQSLPIQPSPMELADQMLAAGKLTDARREYEQQLVAAAGDASIEREAHFKLGRTLELLGEASEARRSYERAVSQNGTTVEDRRTQVVAAIYLWALALKEKDYDLGEQIYTSVITPNLNNFETSFASLAPVELRRHITGYYSADASGFASFRTDPQRVEKMKKLIEIQQAWNISPDLDGWTQLQLVRALRWEERPDLAAQYLQEWLASTPVDDGVFGVLFAAKFGWVMRELNSPQRALTEIDRRLFRAPGQYRTPCLPLLIDRARTLISLDRFDEAERALEEYLRLDPQHFLRYRDYTDACLLLGLLKDRRGDTEGALQTWEKGARLVDPSDPSFADAFGGVTAVINCVILGVFAGTLTDEHLELIVSASAKGVRNGGVGAGLVRVASQALRRMWLTPESKELAWQYARQSDSFLLYVLHLMQQFTDSFAEIDTFPQAMTPEQHQLVREFAATLLTALRSGELSLAQILFLAASYKSGTTGLLGWSSVAPTLQPQLRGPTAYILSQRLRRLGRPSAEIRKLLEAAQKDAETESLLQRLANQELERLP